MCTAITYRCKDVYFGRNLDVVSGYNESVVITPRNFKIEMRCMKSLENHYAMIGMATVIDDFPLYYEATNELGVSIAGLSFIGNAYYHRYMKSKNNVAPFEFIPYILGQCASIGEVKEKLADMNMVNIDFDSAMPLSPLHWIISDREKSIVVESVRDGLYMYDNPFEVLTNNPGFEYHMMNLCNYMGLSIGPLQSRFDAKLPLCNYSYGMGALGLPGDYSSASRFVKAFFVKEHSISDETEESCVNQFFRILGSVSMPKGCVMGVNGYEYTWYSSCCNVDKGIYYYLLYEKCQIKSICIYDYDLHQDKLHIHHM